SDGTSGTENAEGKIVSRGDSLGTGTTPAETSTTPIISQETEVEATTDVTFDLKNALSYVSEKIECDNDNKQSIVGGAQANDDDLVT
ncbi:hypothetical protein Q0M56_13855, partial [Staphylococcus aureus]|nr:hypothetical protein [Staphylococcus aureus]